MDRDYVTMEEGYSVLVATFDRHVIHEDATANLSGLHHTSMGWNLM